jgi:hypothetical protein
LCKANKELLTWSKHPRGTSKAPRCHPQGQVRAVVCWKPTETETTEQRTAADPKTNDASTGTGTSHHLTHPPTHTHTQRRRRRPGGPGERLDSAASCTKRSRGRAAQAQQGAARWGAAWRARHVAVATCWQQCWQNGRCGPVARRAPAAIAFARDVLVPRMLHEGCVVDVALVPGLLPVLPFLELCDAEDSCGCVGVHATLNLRTNGLHDVGARGHGVAIAQKTSIVRDQVVENQRSVERTTARRDHTPYFCLCGICIPYH